MQRMRQHRGNDMFRSFVIRGVRIKTPIIHFFGSPLSSSSLALQKMQVAHRFKIRNIFAWPLEGTSNFRQTPF
jgi:hypothetical protein